MAHEDAQVEKESSYLPRIAGGAVINFSGIAARLVFVYLYTFMLARLLPVDELGQYFLMFTIINLLGLAGMVGLDLGVVRFVSLFLGEKKYSQVKTSVRVGVLLGVPAGAAFAVLLFLAAPVVSEQFFDSSAVSVTGLRVFALALPFMVGARLFNATTQGMLRMQYQVYSRDVGEQAFKIVLSLALLLLGAGLLGVVWANVAAVVMATGLSLLFALMVLYREATGIQDQVADSVGREESGRPHQSPVGMILRYSYPLAFANVLVALWLQIDTLLLGYFGTSADVGYYGVAMKLALFISKSITAFGTVFTPIIADLWNRKRTRELQDLYITTSRWIFTLSLPVFLVMVVFSDSVLSIFGPGFEAGSAALIVLAGGQLASAATGAAGIMVLMSGRSKLELLNVSGAVVVNVVLCLLLIPKYGIIGAAIAHMSAIVVVNTARISEILFLMRMFAYDRSFLKPILAGTAGALLTVLIGRIVTPEAGLVQLAVLASLLLFSYVLAMVVLGLNEQDKMLLKRIRAGAARFKTT